MEKNTKVVVVYGGTSTERDVSLRSGQAVYEGLVKAGYVNTSLFDLKGDNLSELLAQKPDIAYLALHGKGGEDGCLQGALQLAGIPYTGPGVATSAICMDKVLTKQILKAFDLPTPDYLVFHRYECKNREAIADRLYEKFGLPMVLKSPCQGSSIGVVIAREKKSIIPAMEEIFTYGDQLLVEEFIEGTELTLPVIGNEEPQILPEIEITSEREFYDFTAKYTTGQCHHIIPARISEEERQKLRQIGGQVYRKLNCCGVSRIDFIINEKKGPMVIEVNTLPGMTEMSLVPDAGRAAGISFDDLVSRILTYGKEAVRE